MAFHRCYWHRKHGRDVFGKHIFLIAQNYDEPRLFRQGSHELTQSLRQERIFGARRGQRLASIFLAELCKLPSALVVDTAMGGYFAEPELQVIFRLKRGQRAVELQEDVLGQLLCRTTVCQKMQGDAEDHRLIATYDLTKIGSRGFGVVCGQARWHGDGHCCLTSLYAARGPGECRKFDFRQEFHVRRSLLLRDAIPWGRRRG